MRFLTKEEVLRFHEQQIARFGGSEGIRDEGLLDAALGAPEATFDGEYLHKDAFEMAAAYAFHIAQNQPFVDGNKRTGLHAALVFLHLNGWRVPGPEPALEALMLDIAEGHAKAVDLAHLFRQKAHSHTS